MSNMVLSQGSRGSNRSSLLRTEAVMDHFDDGVGCLKVIRRPMPKIRARSHGQTRLDLALIVDEYNVDG